MGKIKSERERKKEGKGTEQKNSKLLVSFTPISLLLAIVALVGELYITVKYIGKDNYANYSLLLLFLGIIAIVGVFYLNKERNDKIQFQYQFMEEPVMWIFYIAFIVLILSISWAIAKITVRFALSTTDMYFYYISTAVIEELFFRMFLCSFLKLKINLHPAIVVLISSLLFTLIHIEAYYNKPYALVVMCVGGLVFSISYLKFKDITIPMVAHVIINLVAVGNLLMVAT